MQSRSRVPCNNQESNDPVRVLLIDDEADSLLPTLAQDLEHMGFSFEKESSARRAMQSVERSQPDVILLDLHFPGDERLALRTTGGNLLPEIRRRFGSIAVVVFSTRLDDADIPLETFDDQPHGWFAKPAFGHDQTWPVELAASLRNAIDLAQQASAPSQDELGFVVGKSDAMKRVAASVRSAARNSLNVLVYGETGSGKQLVANAIHRLSGRKGRFEQVNCSGVHEETLDALLFGHERGAFTGAQKASEGLFELASGGTLFLDEIQRMPMSLQNKLMLIIENGRLRRMGATVDKLVDVRLVAATNHTLADLVNDGALREDLAYRFITIQITLPPLRERMGDLPELFGMAVAKANSSMGRSVKTALRPETLKKLESHSWPGNIREFESTILRAVAETKSNVLLPDDIVFAEVRREALPGLIVPAHDDVSPRLQGVDLAGAEVLADRIGALPVKDRYGLLCGQTDGDLRSAVLTEVVRRLRNRLGRKVAHKDIAAFLDPLENGLKDLDRIRQFVNGSIKLTQLDFNQ